MMKKEDDSKIKVITKIIDFLLEEVLQIDKYDLKVEIFINVCNFLKEWYIRKEDVILPEKTFDCLNTLMNAFKQIGIKTFIELIAFVLKPSIDEENDKTFTLIDLINFMDKPMKRKILIELMKAVLSAVLGSNRSEEYRAVKPILIKLLSQVLIQSNTVWNMCLKYEDDYKNISAIKDKLARIDDFVVYYIQETEKLSVLYDRLCQVMKEGDKNGLASTSSSSILDINNASMLNLKVIRMHELKEETHRELRLSKNKTDNNQETIININKRQTSMTFWFKNRNEHILSEVCRYMERYIEFEQNKRFTLSFSDVEMDAIYHKQGFQYLMAVSQTLSLDCCSRKVQVVKKKFEDLNIKQRFSSLKEEFIYFKPKTNTASPIRKQRTFELPKLNQGEITSQIDSNENQPSEDAQDAARRDNLRRKQSKNTSTSRTSSENRAGRINDKTPQQGTAMDTLLRKKMSDNFDDDEKRFEYVFEILGYCFGIEDKISMGYNVGMMVKDWNYPMDCVLLIGEKAAYIKTNFMIRYGIEKESKTLVNLVRANLGTNKEASNNPRSYHLGKWYMDIEEMTKPFSEDSLTKNKFRKDKAETLDRLYEIKYSDISEIHSKHYIGRCPIALEIWTKHRRPYFLVFNKNQVVDAWTYLFENWVKETTNSVDNVNEVRKGLKTAIGTSDDTVVLYKMVEEGNSKLMIRLTTSDELVQRLKKKWVTGYLDNFTYLMALNAAAGRSLKFISSYYIFPQVVKDYMQLGQFKDQKDFNRLAQLKDAVLRDLSKPMGVTTRKETETLMDKYNHAPEGYGFHHGSLYSNKNILEHYLYRVMPYTQYQFDLNSGRVDSVGRMFKNFQINYTLSAEINFFEMVPENYYLEQYLVNMNNLAFYEEAELDNVDLPEWTNLNPRLFTLMMRKTLESETVSKNLGKWIDLIFGVAQTGKEAVERINIFQPGNYLYGPEAIKDKTEGPRNKKNSTHLEFVYPFQCGQVPAQLFKEDHPAKVSSIDINRSSLQVSVLKLSNLQKYTNPELEKLDKNSERMSKMNHMQLLDDHMLTFGPIGNIFAKIKDLKQR